jgi:hypothetical protein
MSFSSSLFSFNFPTFSLLSRGCSFFKHIRTKKRQRRRHALSVTDEALHYFIENSKLRVILLNGLTSSGIEGLRKLRPTPDAFSIIADTANMDKLFKKVTFFCQLHVCGLKIPLHTAPRCGINSFAGTMDFNVHRQCGNGEARRGCGGGGQ